MCGCYGRCAAYMLTHDGACALAPSACAREELYPDVAGLVERDNGGGDLSQGMSVPFVVKQRCFAACLRVTYRA